MVDATLVTPSSDVHSEPHEKRRLRPGAGGYRRETAGFIGTGAMAQRWDCGYLATQSFSDFVSGRYWPS